MVAMTMMLESFSEAKDNLLVAKHRISHARTTSVEISNIKQVMETEVISQEEWKNKIEELLRIKWGQLYAWKLYFNQSFQFNQYPLLSQGFEYPIILLPYRCMKVQPFSRTWNFIQHTWHDNEVPINSMYVLQYQVDYILSTVFVPTMILNRLNLIAHNIMGEILSMPAYEVCQDGHAPT